MLNLLSNVETSLYEIAMLNHQYDQIQLRNFPFGGDIIFVRIIRNNESIGMAILSYDTETALLLQVLKNMLTN